METTPPTEARHLPIYPFACVTCDDLGVVEVDGHDEYCTCDAGKDLQDHADTRPIGLDPEVMTILDEDEQFHSLPQSEQLRRLGAPAFAYVDASDAACCADGLCGECEGVI